MQINEFVNRIMNVLERKQTQLLSELNEEEFKAELFEQLHTGVLYGLDSSHVMFNSLTWL